VITSGEGGMIVTADERIRDEALGYRDQGKAGFQTNLHTRLGYAWRMSEVHAAVGLVHLRRLAEFITVRQRVAARSTAELGALEGFTPLAPDPRARVNHYKYPALLDERLDRESVRNELRKRFAVSLSGEVYDTPLHRQPVFAHLARAALPGAERFCERHVCLPVHSDMTDAEVDRVIEAVTAICAAA
jgi:dTDP-4-amino-4,6-dideoxygalactose transaminase